MSQDADPAPPGLPSGIYLDDCSFKYRLVAELRAAGFQVVTPPDAGLLGATDADHLAYAARSDLALLTRNPRDFIAQQVEHAGILAVYQDNDPSRDMSDAETAHAVLNLFTSGLPIRGQVHVLNHWR